MRMLLCQKVVCGLITGLAVLVASEARAECTCSPEGMAKSVRQADRIFRGMVVSANLKSAQSKFIEFTVQVDKIIRGGPEKQIRLKTKVPGACGISVRMGFHDLFILQPGNNVASRCAGSGRDAYMENPHLEAAITLVDYPASDASDAIQVLNHRFYSSYDRASIDEFFELVTSIDPAGHPVVSLDDQIQYRGIAFYFKDGQFEKADAL